MKNKLLMSMLIISIMANIGLAIYINNSISKAELRELGLISQADMAIDDAVNSSGRLADQWNDLSVAEIVNYLNHIDKELYVAMMFLSGADSYFAPLKDYSENTRLFVHELLNGKKKKESFNAYQNEYHSLQYLWEFLAENRIADLGIEEVRLRWNEKK